MRTHTFSTLAVVAFAVYALLSGPPVIAETPEQALNAEAGRIDGLAASQGQSEVAGKIIAEFQSFAGSYSNASSLLTGLRHGGAITLTRPNCPAVSFTPSTGKIGYGEAPNSSVLS